MNKISCLAILIFISITVHGQNGVLVLQTDFGLKDGAVAAMKGVALGVSSEIKIFDLTHEIPAYNIWEAAYRLGQTASYWPVGTVFVSVIDPGVGSSRKSIVLKTKSGHFFVSPDNGSLTLVADLLGVESVREIDESINRLKNSQESYTFHGRDVYAFTGARLASKAISFEQVGRLLEAGMVTLQHEKARIEGKNIVGMIDILDVQYGNVWTNISAAMLKTAGIKYGDFIHVRVTKDGREVVDQEVKLATTFSEVNVGDVVSYVNSLGNFSLGINQDDYAKKYHVSSGSGWKIVVSKLDR